MDFAEYFFAALIVLVLLGLAGYYGWRQVHTLRGLRVQHDLSPEDRRYFRAQAWRRLAGCVLMLLMAGLLAGSYLLGQERHAHELSQPRAAEGQPAAPSGGERLHFVHQYGTFWIILSLVLLVWVGLALVDVWAIRRYGRRHYRQIQADRRAMIEGEVAKFRSQRDGHE